MEEMPARNKSSRLNKTKPISIEKSQILEVGSQTESEDAGETEFANIVVKPNKESVRVSPS